ncbi:MAG TPA: PH domain-containing protein [Candidatus Saccharimonadales bacterium]|nr:PH domain-containing protein [Candidatus Saccharimonadales bacterium]
MQVTPETDQLLHSKLPIEANEKILAVYRHHWFAYASNWIVAGLLVLVIMVSAILIVSFGGSETNTMAFREAVVIGAGILSMFIVLGASIPVYLRSQEQLVLSEEALMQVLRPSLFASKIDQLNLQRMDDVSVRQGFLGSILGYGHITVETPGEQDNYEFLMLPNPHEAAREITHARENYEAAMQSGRLPTTMGAQPAAAPTIDPQEYQQFVEFQRMQARQAAEQRTSNAESQDSDANPADSQKSSDQA